MKNKKTNIIRAFVEGNSYEFANVRRIKYKDIIRAFVAKENIIFHSPVGA